MPTVAGAYWRNLKAATLRPEVLTGRIKAKNAGGTTILDCAVSSATLTPAAPNATSVVCATSTAQATATESATSVVVETSAGSTIVTFGVGAGEVFTSMALTSGNFYNFSNLTTNT